jgi:Recombination endonuclease VII
MSIGNRPGTEGPCRNCGETTLYIPKNRGRSQNRNCRKCRTIKRRNARLKKMGLSSRQHEADIQEANGHCNVCGSIAKTLNRDHCHASGKARGLLCLSCNLILGHAKDDIELLVELIAYLEYYEDLHSTINDPAA